VRANLTQEEVEDAQRQLARDIPNDKDGLWRWPVSWEHLPEKNIDKDIKDWAANKVLELMGLQEEMLVDAIVEHLKSRGGPQALVENLEVALDDEAEALVRKLWRMVIYYSETEKRGIK
jgi:RNA-binding protein 25